MPVEASSPLVHSQTESLQTARTQQIISLVIVLREINISSDNIPMCYLGDRIGTFGVDGSGRLLVVSKVKVCGGLVQCSHEGVWCVPHITQ